MSPEYREVYREVFLAARDAILVFDASTLRIVNANESALHLYGYSRDELLALTVMELSAEPDKSATSLKQLEEDRFDRLYPLRAHRRKDGSEIWVEISASRFSLGERVLGVGVIRDLTQRRQAEQTLRDSEERFRELTENIEEVFWLCDPPLDHIFYISPSYETVWGRSRESLIQNPRSFVDSIHADDRASVLLDLQKLEQGFNRDYRIVRPDGAVRIIHARGFPVRNAAGAVTRVSGIAEDVTQRRRDEARVRMLLDSAAEGIYGVDPEGNCTFVNRTGLGLLHYNQPEDLIGKNMHATMHHTRSNGSSYALSECPTYQALHDSRHGHSDYEVLWRSDGTSFPCEYWSQPVIEDGCVVAAVVSFVDISIRKKAENIARRAEKMSAVGQLAGGIAHEINNPLGVILGFAQAAIRRLPLHDPLEMPLKSIEREALRCQALAKNLLKFSRTSKDERAPVDLNRAVEEAMPLIMAKASLTHVQVQKELAANLPPLIGNANEIQEVIINLAGNSIDAMEIRGILTLKTEKVVEGPVSNVCLRVQDTGPGISADALTRIFEPFFTTKPEGKGTGLGLSLVQEIVAKHSGTIDVLSRPGRTEFCIKFPIESPKI